MASDTGNTGYLAAIFIAGVVAGASYCLAAWGGWHGEGITAWKGTGVGLLALWAAAQARERDGWTIAAVLALGAMGDVLLDAVGLTAGGLAFLAGHGVAILLYLRHRRPVLSDSQRVLALTLPTATPIIGWWLSHDIGMTLYAFGVGAMAGAAWASSFPRYRVGTGAILFVASDLLILSRMGPLADSTVPTLLVWPTYFAAQALIAWGMVTTLRLRSQVD